jgi:hypothetical protein
MLELPTGISIERQTRLARAKLVAQGHTNRDVSRELYLSEDEVCSGIRDISCAPHGDFTHNRHTVAQVKSQPAVPAIHRVASALARGRVCVHIAVTRAHIERTLRSGRLRQSPRCHR